MSIGNFFSALGTGIRGLVNGAVDVGEKLPVVGGQIKQLEDAKNQIANAGNTMFNNRTGTAQSYASPTDDSKDDTSPPQIGNFMANQKEGKDAGGAAKKGEEAESSANAAKTAAADDAAAEEMAAMLI